MHITELHSTEVLVNTMTSSSDRPPDRPVSDLGPIIGGVTAAVVVMTIAIGTLILFILWCGKRQRCIAGGGKSAIDTEPVYEVVDLEPSSKEAVHVATNMSTPLPFPPLHKIEATPPSHIEVEQNPAYYPIAEVEVQENLAYNTIVEVQENLAYTTIAPH